MHFDFVIFDLDGTLVDSFTDIFLSVDQLLLEYHGTSLDASAVRACIGKGVRHLVECTLRQSDAEVPDINDALLRYSAIYEARSLDHTTLYPGAAGCLGALTETQCAVLTNKPEIAARRILSALNIDHYFSFIAGGDTFSCMKPSPEPVSALLRMAGVAAERVLMVGDSVYDIEAAHRAGASACAVTWGFQPVEMLKALNPEFTVSAFEDLLAVMGVTAPMPDQLNR